MATKSAVYGRRGSHRRTLCRRINARRRILAPSSLSWCCRCSSITNQGRQNVTGTAGTDALKDMEGMEPVYLFDQGSMFIGLPWTPNSLVPTLVYKCSGPVSTVATRLSVPEIGAVGDRLESPTYESRAILLPSIRRDDILQHEVSGFAHGTGLFKCLLVLKVRATYDAWSARRKRVSWGLGRSLAEFYGARGHSFFAEPPKRCVGRSNRWT